MRHSHNRTATPTTVPTNLTYSNRCGLGVCLLVCLFAFLLACSRVCMLVCLVVCRKRQVHCELETWHSSSQARIEIPGQYASCDGEPRPDLHAKLLRFHSTVSVLHRWATNRFFIFFNDSWYFRCCCCCISQRETFWNSQYFLFGLCFFLELTWWYRCPRGWSVSTVRPFPLHVCFVMFF